ncbi:hypothetical protein NFC73_00755 [Pseudarthrobacter sp. RMG13]|uniref:Uncharacterized protein n=1 Tax=Pseudarthrobacter humi TaxID=2952523 RepID=A0ABT1LII7_9MICC|nr:hypothetical protein [Pseudarthrobacter humi]MCP8998269.1 hypothetical protein [Pseudarthrobacter humi]
MDVDDVDPWIVQITWEMEDGTSRPVRFDVRGRDGQPIDPSDTFRKMATVIEDSRVQLAGLYDDVASFWESHGHVRPAAKVRKQIPKGPGRKPTLPEGHFELIAALYVKFRDQENVSRPVQAVADFLLNHDGYREYATAVADPKLTNKRRAENLKSWRNRVNTWVNRAKKMGLIPGERNKENG